MRTHRASMRACRTTSLLCSYNLISMLATSRPCLLQRDLLTKSWILAPSIRSTSRSAESWAWLNPWTAPSGREGPTQASPSARALWKAARLAQACSRQTQSVREAAQANPHGAWPWAVIPARPHPTLLPPDRPSRPQPTFLSGQHSVRKRLLQDKRFCENRR